MTRITDSKAVDHLEERMVSTFGVGSREYDAGIAMHPVPKAHLNTATRVADTSGIPEMLSKWDSDRRKSNAGKKAIIPLRALVVLYLMNAQMGVGVSYMELARTLAYRFSTEHFAALGIRTTLGDTQHWYKRVSDTTYRLIALMDPTPTPLRKIMNADQFDKLLQSMEAPDAKALQTRNQERLDDFCNGLVHASYRMLPADLRDKYKGNTAIDATKAPIRGSRNSASKAGSRSNPDPLAGRYRREGSHGGIGAATDEAAYELETAVMIWNRPGESSAFPSLLTEIGCHAPGRLVGHAAAMTARHMKLGFVRPVLVVDRAYNYERIQTFHEPLIRLGVDTVFDYQVDDLGVQSHFADLQLVDGSWYVEWMPENLVNATRERAKVEEAVADAEVVVYQSQHPTGRKGPTDTEVSAAKKTIADARDGESSLRHRIANRDAYRMIPKGKRDKDGFQRFSYPPFDKMLVRPKALPNVTSITVPPVLPETEGIASGTTSRRKPKSEQSKNTRGKSHPVKFAQHLPYESDEWRAWFGMRNLVETSNKLLKTPLHGDIENVNKRSGRGYAATYMTLAFAAVCSNMRRIATFFHSEAERIQRAATLTRTRRRRDERGMPLARVPHMALAEPRA
ncbi:hypothetical protein FB562_0451 [Homoserinimonas aerilata]|uniref:Uncharacterized protein n=1 Tax=Homoserinimonas aerilata TaxID=1162970 RepID=A0A542YH13_9MICO|nr:hypothetical protein [Homoserinimonas aerilata]TQL47393.1 hypothetical protein FB562_0451 [Homoserinimonas aerilata]